MEIWKEYPSNTDYLVSSNGLVKHKVNNKIRKFRKNLKGYLRLNMQMNGKHTTCLVHRMVAESHIERVPGKDQVNHIDNNPENNSVSNLEWCTHTENMQHSASQGRKGHGTLYTREQIYAVKYTYIHLSIQETSDITGVKTATISRVRKGDQWSNV